MSTEMSVPMSTPMNTPFNTPTSTNFNTLMNTPLNTPASTPMSSFIQPSRLDVRQGLSHPNSPARFGSQMSPILSPMSRFEAAIIQNRAEFHDAMIRRELALATRPTIRQRRIARALDQGRPALPYPSINRPRSIAIAMKIHQQETEYGEFSRATRMNKFRSALIWESHVLETKLAREQERASEQERRFLEAWSRWQQWELPSQQQFEAEASRLTASALHVRPIDEEGATSRDEMELP